MRIESRTLSKVADPSTGQPEDGVFDALTDHGLELLEDGSIIGTPTRRGHFKFLVWVMGPDGHLIAELWIHHWVVPHYEWSNTWIHNVPARMPIPEDLRSRLDALSPRGLRYVALEPSGRLAGVEVPPDEKPLASFEEHGIKIDPETGTLFGTPLKRGHFHFLAHVLNLEGEMVAELWINHWVIPHYIWNDIPWKVGVPGEQPFPDDIRRELEGLGPDLTFEVAARGTVRDGDLLNAEFEDNGLIFDRDRLVISGTPQREGDFVYLIRVRDANGELVAEIWIRHRIEGDIPHFVWTQMWKIGEEGISAIPNDVLVELERLGGDVLQYRLPEDRTEGDLAVLLKEHGFEFVPSVGRIRGIPIRPGHFKLPVLVLNANEVVAEFWIDNWIIPHIEVEHVWAQERAGRKPLPRHVLERLQELSPEGFEFQEADSSSTDPEGKTMDSLAEIGLELDSATGTIFGTPARPGHFLALVYVFGPHGKMVAELWIHHWVVPHFEWERTWTVGEPGELPVPEDILARLRELSSDGLRFSTAPAGSDVDNDMANVGTETLGLKLDPERGLISGTPRLPGHFVQLVRVHNAAGDLIAELWIRHWINRPIPHIVWKYEWKRGIEAEALLPDDIVARLNRLSPGGVEVVLPGEAETDSTLEEFGIDFIPGLGGFIGAPIKIGHFKILTWAVNLKGEVIAHIWNDHWVDPGFIERNHFEQTRATMTLMGPRGYVETIDLAGPTWIDVLFEDDEGEAVDNDNNGLEEVDTRVRYLDLRGVSQFGKIQVIANPEILSTGVIEEKANNTDGILDVPPFTSDGTANSWFNMYFKIMVFTREGTITLVNLDPKLMQSMIAHKPPEPGATYEGPEIIPLFFPDGSPSGFTLGPASHVPNVPHYVEHDHFEHSFAQMTLLGPNNFEESVNLSGPTWVDVWFEEREGKARDDDNNQLDEVMTKMTSLELQGMSSLGHVTVRLNPDVESTGVIEEKVNLSPGTLDVLPFVRPVLADAEGPLGDVGAAGRPVFEDISRRLGANSWFELFLEIVLRTPDGQEIVVRNQDPKVMRSMIFHKPPGRGTAYESPEIIPLFLLDGTPSGFSLGPGRHVPNPEIEIDPFRQSTATIVLRLPGGEEAAVELEGPSVVHVVIGQNGESADVDGDGLDAVPTEMVQLDLRGDSPLGPVRLTLDPSHPSLGAITERQNNTPGILDIRPFVDDRTTQADSFFDVFTEISFNGQTFHPAEPIRMQTILHHKPPRRDVYENPFEEPIELLDATGQPTGIQLVSEIHRPNPPRPVVSIWDVSTGGIRRIETRSRELARWYRHYEWTVDSRIWLNKRAEGVWITREALSEFTCKSHCILPNPNGPGVWQIWRTFTLADVVRFRKHFRIFWTGRLNPIAFELNPDARDYALSLDHVEVVLPMEPSDPNPGTPENEGVMVIDENGNEHFLGGPGFDIMLPDTAGNPDGFQLATTALSTKNLPVPSERIRDVPMPLNNGMVEIGPGVAIEWLVDDDGTVLVDRDGDGEPDALDSDGVLGNLHQGIVEPLGVDSFTIDLIANPLGLDEVGIQSEPFLGEIRLTIDQGENPTQLNCWVLDPAGEVLGHAGQVVAGIQGKPVDTDGDGEPDGPGGGPMPMNPTNRELVTDEQGIREVEDMTVKPVDLVVVAEDDPSEEEVDVYFANIMDQFPGFVPPQRPFGLCIRQVQMRRFWGIDRRVIPEIWLHHVTWRLRHHVTLQRGAYRVWLTRKAIQDIRVVDIHREFGKPEVRYEHNLQHIRFFRICYRVIALEQGRARVKIDQIIMVVPVDPDDPNSELMVLTTEGSANRLFPNLSPELLAGLVPDDLPVDDRGIFVEPLFEDEVDDIFPKSTAVFDSIPMTFDGNEVAIASQGVSDLGMEDVVLEGNSDSVDDQNSNQLQLYCWVLNANGTRKMDTFSTMSGELGAASAGDGLDLDSGPSAALPWFEDEDGNPVEDPTPVESAQAFGGLLIDELRVTESGDIELYWSATDAVLQSATVVTGPWTDIIPEPASPYVLTPDEAQRFFRIRDAE